MPGSAKRAGARPRRIRRSEEPSGCGTESEDTNAVVGALLRDLAAVQASTQSKWGYKRAAAAILSLDAPLESLRCGDGTFEKIPNVGPSSLRVVTEVLDTGASETVERAVAASGRAAEVARSRGLRRHFLSRARVQATLRQPGSDGPRLEDYRGDLQVHSEWSDGSSSLDEL